MAKEPYDPVKALCDDLVAAVHQALGLPNLRRAVTWLEAHMDADEWVEQDVELAREVIAFLRAIPSKQGTAELQAIGNQLPNPAIVLLQKRLVELPALLRAAEPLMSRLTLLDVLEKVLIEPWENGLAARLGHRPQD